MCRRWFRSVRTENWEIPGNRVPDCVGCRQSSSSSLERSDRCYRRRCRRLHNDSVPSGRTKSENLRSLISGRSTNTIHFDTRYTVPIVCVRALGDLVFKPPGDPPTDRHHAEGDARQEQQEKLFVDSTFSSEIRHPKWFLDHGRTSPFKVTKRKQQAALRLTPGS